MRLTVHAEGPAIDLDRFVRAIPLLLERARTVGFTADGRAVLDGVATSRLRLVDGTAGRVGAAYLVSSVAAEGPVVATVGRDDAEALAVELTVAEGAEPADQQALTTGTLTLERPAEASRVRVAGTVALLPLPTAPDSAAPDSTAPDSTAPDSTAPDPGATAPEPGPRMLNLVGRRWDVTGQARLAGFDTATEPQLAVRLSGRLGTAHSTAHVTRAGDRWQVDLRIELAPRGVARLAGLVLPFVRRRATEAIAQQVTETLAETAEQIAADFDPADGPAEIADRAWQLIVADLTAPDAG